MSCSFQRPLGVRYSKKCGRKGCKHTIRGETLVAFEQDWNTKSSSIWCLQIFGEQNKMVNILENAWKPIKSSWMLVFPKNCSVWVQSWHTEATQPYIEMWLWVYALALSPTETRMSHFCGALIFYFNISGQVEAMRWQISPKCKFATYISISIVQILCRYYVLITIFQCNYSVQIGLIKLQKKSIHHLKSGKAPKA